MRNQASTHSGEGGTQGGGAAAAGGLAGFGLGGVERLSGLARYRTIAYIATFFSGAVSLTFQVVWQRYLSFLVGSEARSISLVVAVFLLGLAAGYRFWGNFTARGWTRQTMLKAVGYIELGIAGYGLIFPAIFVVVRDIAYAAPDSLLVDFGATAALVFLPTFLMGASIPLLTAAIPATVNEVNYCHTRIYGINTLGAFVGTFIAGFYLVPAFGLTYSLIIGSVINMGVGLAFLFNTLDGDIRKGEDVPPIPNKFGSSGIYLFVFVTGAVTIAFEVLFMRVLALSIGSGHYVFPIVVGIVIMGLAIGSLSIRRGSVTANRVIYELVKLGVLLVAVYYTVPYWPYWISHLRISLVTLPSNYIVFLGLVVVFMMVILLPIVIPMGRLLPMGYSLIDKHSADYGRLCGRVYFSNTVGTVVGAVGIGYLLLIFMDVDSIFRLNIALIFLLAAYLVLRQFSIGPALGCALLAGLVLVLHSWNRDLHSHGLFRVWQQQPYHFSGVFVIPEIPAAGERVFFTDDPSVTVSVNRIISRATGLESRTIFVNGKSDGNTIADYSNMALTAMMPYLYSSRDRDIDAAVIGLGMGVTSGALAKMPDVREMVTIEISSGVIQAAKHFEDSNFGLLANEKHRMVQTDAFRFFTRSQQKFDLIISEPSNPWVVGVENLYTPEFYQLAVDRLNDDGIFFQWLQLYEMNSGVLAAIAENVTRHFEHVSLYVLGTFDIGIIASNEPLTAPHLQRRMEQQEVKNVLWPMAIEDVDLFHALKLMSTEQLRAFSLSSMLPVHRMERPWLGHAAGRARFLVQSVRFESTQLAGTGRHLIDDPVRRETFERLVTRYGNNLQRWCAPPERRRHSTGFICSILETLTRHHAALQRPLTPHQIEGTLSAYHHLREHGFIEARLSMLDRMRGMLFEDPPTMGFDELRDAIAALVAEYALEWEWDRAKEFIAEARQRGLLDPMEYEQYDARIDRLRFESELRMWELSEWRTMTEAMAGQ